MKMKKKREKVRGEGGCVQRMEVRGGGQGRCEGGGGSDWEGGGQGGWERRIEAFVEKKYI